MSETSNVAVALQWAGTPGQKVELCGDFPDWRHPILMTEAEPGEYECHLKLKPGLYRYKFCINEEQWIVDPNALLIDTSEGFQNSVLVVGGTLEPVVFAPDRQHCAQWEDGRLVVHVETQIQNRKQVLLHLTTGKETPSSQEEVVPFLPVMTRKNRRLLRAEIRRSPTSLPWTHMHFEDEPTRRFLLPSPRTPLGQPPDWLDRGVFYAIFLDRWHRGTKSKHDERIQPRDSSSQSSTFYGGDIDGVIESLDYLSSFGITGIILTPIHCSPTPHRYDSTDLMTIDPALGGKSALIRLLEAAHQRQLKVIVDVSLTHVNEQHPSFQDVLQNQERSPYTQWFYIRDFPVVSGNADTYSHYPEHPELPWLNLGPGEARKHVLKSVEQLVRWGVDGLRLDAVEEAPDDFWQELRSRMRHINPDLMLLGEIVSDKPGRLAEHCGMDTVTDFQHREAMLDFFARGQINAQEFWDQLTFYQFRIGPFDPSFLMLFLDNHDLPRFLSVAQSTHRLRLALAYLMFRPEPLWLTHGTEFELRASSSKATDLWEERMPIPTLNPNATPTQDLLRQLLKLRHSLEPMQSPVLRLIKAKEQLLVLERFAYRTSLRGYFCAGEKPMKINDLPKGAQQVLAVNVEEQEDPFHLPPHSARWFLLHPQHSEVGSSKESE